jgi:hypothetical protein
LPSHLHHVVVRSHSADTYIRFLVDVVGMPVLHTMRVSGDLFEKTLGWPPSDGGDVTMLGDGNAGMVAVLDVPENLRDTVPEGLGALSFQTDDFGGTQAKASALAGDVRLFDAGPGVNAFFCTAGGVITEFIDSYGPLPADWTNAPASPH